MTHTNGGEASATQTVRGAARARKVIAGHMAGCSRLPLAMPLI
jgi:hypothetical protein